MASAPKRSVTLHYFDLPGRAELTRLTLTVGGVEFEDVRVKKEDWPALKPTMPMLQMPVLTVDGVKIPQSHAIVRVAARMGGLYPEDIIQAGLVDASLDGFHDLMHEYYMKVMFEKDEATKKANAEKFATETLPKWLGIFEAQIAANSSDYLVGDKMTVADICLGQVFAMVQGAGLSVDKDTYPNFVALGTQIQNLDAIKAWNAAHAKKE